MKELLDAFWRAAAYCLHPRIIWLSLLPLLLSGGLALLLGYLYWDAAIVWLNAALDGWRWVVRAIEWFASMGFGGIDHWLAPLLLVAMAVPVLVVLSLLLVALIMTPAIVKLVGERRFAHLGKRHGGGLVSSAAWSIGCTLLALLALLVTVPLWFIPPLILLVPPLIWGWLTTKVMSFDVLAEHADRDERRALMRERRWPLLLIGIITGYLGAAPTVIWAFGALTLVFAPLLVVASIWLYTLIFAFSALWFAHYALAALAQRRALEAPPGTRPTAGVLPQPGAQSSLPPSPPALPPAAPLP